MKTTTKEVITERPVRKVKYLKTLKKENCSTREVKNEITFNILL